jgi:hypothetical protein
VIRPVATSKTAISSLLFSQKTPRPQASAGIPSGLYKTGQTIQFLPFHPDICTGPSSRFNEKRNYFTKMRTLPIIMPAMMVVKKARKEIVGPPGWLDILGRLA